MTTFSIATLAHLVELAEKAEVSIYLNYIDITNNAISINKTDLCSLLNYIADIAKSTISAKERAFLERCTLLIVQKLAHLEYNF